MVAHLLHRTRRSAARMSRGNRAGRPLLVAAIVMSALALVVGSASALTVRTTSVVHVGSGAARLTTYTNGTGSLYVNLKGLASGTWNEHLWSGTCTSLGTRVAVLPGLAVPASGALARTNALTVTQAAGKTLRIVHGSQVRCATFELDPQTRPHRRPEAPARPRARRLRRAPQLRRARARVPRQAQVQPHRRARAPARPRRSRRTTEQVR